MNDLFGIDERSFRAMSEFIEIHRATPCVIAKAPLVQLRWQGRF